MLFVSTLPRQIHYRESLNFGKTKTIHHAPPSICFISTTGNKQDNNSCVHFSTITPCHKTLNTVRSQAKYYIDDWVIAGVETLKAQLKYIMHSKT